MLCLDAVSPHHLPRLPVQLSTITARCLRWMHVQWLDSLEAQQLEQEARPFSDACPTEGSEGEGGLVSVACASCSGSRQCDEENLSEEEGDAGEGTPLAHGLGQLGGRSRGSIVDSAKSVDEKSGAAEGGLRCGAQEPQAAQGGGCDTAQAECSICLTETCRVAVAGCHHDMCTICARRLCLEATKEPLCPFCRRVIGRFEALA